MKTVKQVSLLTGVSVRTLQFYDEIDLFKPSQVTDAGYRLYDDDSLVVLQQILFFKELDFTLKEIKEIMDKSTFNRLDAFKKQKTLIQMKRDRLNRLLSLLEKLEKGETVMDFKEFDMNDYFTALEEFKRTLTDAIVKKFGDLDKFDEMVSELKSNESKIAELAIQVYGSVENYVKASEKNIEKFLQEEAETIDVAQLIDKTDYLTRMLTADLSKDVESDEIQATVRELIDFCNQNNNGLDVGENYWGFMAENYLTNPVFINVTDKKYGEGASEYIGKALQYYLG
ncbi:MAG: MerR family transcriptional regulator [Clostridium sp.]|uniref:MerR family transcriptional regulator n=1 Tax=Clostridium sp. TaxID=1506 RepID=UPI00290E8141|nr:MerR family transcriptional regulator [Clostridium sp.]MDU7337529.1 MerR family transcriptional regulator [Clostridium sp.]